MCIQSPRRARGYKQYDPVTTVTTARTTITSDDGMVIRSGGNTLPQARTTTMSMLFYCLLVYLCVGFTHANFAAVFESTPPSSYGNDHGGDFKYLFLPCLLLSFFFSLSLSLFIFCLASRRAVPYIRRLPGSRRQASRPIVCIYVYTKRVSLISRLRIYCVHRGGLLFSSSRTMARRQLRRHVAGATKRPSGRTCGPPKLLWRFQFPFDRACLCSDVSRVCTTRRA